nr:zinc-finger-containing protein [uncultured Rhodoferax sp.]
MSGRAVTPWAPSRRAAARVTNPLPVPEVCPHCGAPCSIVNNSLIYGREYGEWPWAVLCQGCEAYVGLHPFTGIPLGTLATAEIRNARKRAKSAFNPLWQQGGMSRSEAYAWLAKALGIADVNACHIGWFDVAQCNAVVAAINKSAGGEA